MREALICNQHALSMQLEAISMHSEAHAPIRAMPNGPCTHMQSACNQSAISTHPSERCPTAPAAAPAEMQI